MCSVIKPPQNLSNSEVENGSNKRNDLEVGVPDYAKPDRDVVLVGRTIKLGKP